MTDVLTLIGQHDDYQEWISWQRVDPLLALPTTIEDHPPDPDHAPAAADYTSAPSLNRSQYQAVMHRFNQAAKHANRFSAWTEQP